jgi:para-aminobenzoate synthetase
VIDHEAGRTYSLTLVKNGAEECGRRWLDYASMVLAGAGAGAGCAARGPASPATRAELDVTLRSSPAEYARLVRECMSEIRQGETYEVCLTNTITTRRPPDPWETYRDLRRRNPAPYGALLRFQDVQVLSASPERFLRIDRDGCVEAKPIKGTRPRGQTREEDEARAAELERSEKDRAENLMIVDLLRNDLGKVSETGSVHVPVIFDVETYATVHQLVSTVRSRLRAGVSPVACVRAAFPGGSMTGAPKRRTMQIIDRLEGASRGVYSGALGYFALSGAVDLSIVIRTIVVAGESARVGAGGAVVALSDPDDEVAEMLLKARASLDALRATADDATADPADATADPADATADPADVQLVTEASR